MAGEPGQRKRRLAGLTGRYVQLRVRTLDRDDGPGVVLRAAARAPVVTTSVVALLLAAVLVVTFGVPPVSPLLLVPVVCAPLLPWLRLEARAHRTWRARAHE